MTAATAIRTQCQMMAKYNSEANRRLYACCKTLNDAERKRDVGAFFGSIHNTLNHILVADEILFARFEGKVASHTALNAVPHDSFDDLSAARAAFDAHIAAFFETVADDMLVSIFKFKNMAGDSFEKPFLQLVSHVFNHQTHHRGQVTTLLSQAGVETPVLDMPFCLKNEGALL